MLAVLTTLTPALNLGPRLFRPTRSSMVRMQEEVTIAPPKSALFSCRVVLRNGHCVHVSDPSSSAYSSSSQSWHESKPEGFLGFG